MTTARRTFYAVIHAHDVAHGYAQALQALDAGADGLALINQYCTADDVYKLAGRLMPRIPDGRLLVNILNSDTVALDIAEARECGIWADALTGTLQEALTLKQLGELVGSDGAQIWKYEASRQFPTKTRLAQLVEALGEGILGEKKETSP